MTTIEDQIRAERARAKVQTAVTLAMKQKLDALTLDGSEASTQAALAEVRGWLEGLQVDDLDAKTRAGILTAAEMVIHNRAQEAAAQSATKH